MGGLHDASGQEVLLHSGCVKSLRLCWHDWHTRESKHPDHKYQMPAEGARGASVPRSLNWEMVSGWPFPKDGGLGTPSTGGSCGGGALIGRLPGKACGRQEGEISTT